MTEEIRVFEPIEFDFSQLIACAEKLTFLVGAGVSCDPPSNLASARDVMKALVHYGCAKGSVEEILQFQKLRYEYLVQEFRDTYDPELLFMEYYGEFHNPNPNHRFLAQMVEQGHSVMTTNFDTLLERAIGLHDPNLRIVITEEDFKQYDNPDEMFVKGLKPVYKIHGSVQNAATGEDTRRSILTTLDAIGKHKEGDIFSVEVFKRPFFLNVCRNRTLVVMGYSGGDDFDIVPMLLQIQGIKQIIWISHQMDPHAPVRSSKVRLDSLLPPEDTAKLHPLDNLLHQLKVQAGVDVIKLEANTGALLAGLLAERPSAPQDSNPTSVYDWARQKYPPPQRGVPEWFSGKVLINYGFYAESLEWFTKSLEIFRGLGDVQGQAWNYAGIGKALLSTGKPHEALEKFLQASRMNEAVGNLVELSRNYYDLGNTYFSIGQTQEALRYFQKAYEMDKDIGNKQGMASSLTGLATISSFEDLQKGADYYEEAYHLNEEIGDLGEMAADLTGIAGILLSAKQPDRALEYYQQVTEIYGKLGELQGIMNTQSAMGTCYYSLGQVDEAITQYQKSNALAKKLGQTVVIASNLTSMATVYSNTGDYNTVLEYYQKAFALYDQIDSLHGKANVLSMSAVIYFNLGDLEQAVSTLQRAYDINENLGNIDQMAMNLEYLGQFHFDTEQYGLARGYFTRAQALYGQLGHQPKLELCAKYLAAIDEKLN